MKKIEGNVIIGEESLGYIGIPVSEEIAKFYKKNDINRFIFQIDGIEEFYGAFVPYEKGKSMILINADRRKKLGINIGDKIEVLIKADDSKYGMPLPEEMKIAFQEDPEGKDYFHQLTPGKMRSLLHIVSKYKSSDKRIEKAVIILEHLRANLGKLDYKMLNEAFKNYRL